jgi:hypothetical protein
MRMGRTMILLSNGGSNTHRSGQASDTMIVGTVDGIVRLKRSGESWTVDHKALSGCFVSAVTALDDGTLFAATHGVGVARSDDGGTTWAWVNEGLAHFDLWSARAGKLMGRDAVFVGSLPAHLYVSQNKGKTWRELPAFRKAKSAPHWCFPPPPRIGHVKDIVLDGDRLLVGVEIGSLQVSTDFGESFTELPVDPNPLECDIHRILVHPARPSRILISNGLVGVMTSEDNGATWTRNPMPQQANYPDPIVIHPDDPDLVFMSVGVGWPNNWYQLGRARGKIVRSRDAGKTWERLLGGLPNGQRALFSALTIESWKGGYSLQAVDTDGQIYESRDEGESWTVIADVAPVSKGEFYRALVRDRPRLANVDDIVVNEHAARRIAAVG